MRQEPAIALAPDFGKPFEREPTGFAHPCAKQDFVAKRGRSLVVNLVAQHDPADRVLRLATGDRSLMRGGNILDPSQINGVVNVILLVDVGCNHRDDHFETRRRHQKSGQRTEENVQH